MTLLRSLKTFPRDVRGAAAAEFVLILPILLLPLVPMVDIGVFAVQRMQVDSASQAGVAAAWHVCDNPMMPANQTNCTAGGGDLAAAVTAAIQSTNLATNVSLSATPIVGYYCATDAGELTSVSDTWDIAATSAPSKPANCSSVITGSTTAPGQYIQVTVSAPYTPVFGALVAAGILPDTITRSSWRRIA
jgi:Flp pilus assembly protein TadG